MEQASWAAKVFQHGPLTELDRNLWMVSGSLPKGHMPRNMVVYRYAPGKLLIHSPVCLNDETMRALDALGAVTHLIVPSRFHRLDGAAWKQRYPKSRLLSPKAVRRKIAEKMPVDALCEEECPALGIPFHAPSGIRPSELIFEFKDEKGVFLIVTDLLFNLPHLPGFDGLIVRLMGSSGFFGMTKIARLFLLANKQDFAEWLETQAERSDLAGVLPAHGAPVLEDAGASLAAAAARLI